MTTAILGIDIGKSKFDAAVLINDCIKAREFSNDLNGFFACQKWLEKLKASPHICLESTGIYGIAFATFMHENKYTVSVVNPVQIKRFAESELSRNKTDKSDAKVIARFCAAMKPKPWHPAPSHLAELRQYVTYLESLTVMRYQEENRSKCVNESVAEPIKTHIKQIDDLIVSVKTKIDEIINLDDDLRQKKILLETIPGIGYETTIRILGYIGNIEDFESPKQLAAFAGLNPKQHQSGSSVCGKTRLSKTGDQKIRKTFYMPALVAIRYNPAVKEFYERLRKNGKCKMAAIGAVMRKLLHIVYGVLKSRTPFDSKLNVTA